jgi:hypothetical protein
MAENTYFAAIEAPALQIELQPRWLAATLRHFERGAALASLVRTLTGLSLPDVGVARSVTGANGAVTLLAWRNPTETTLLTEDEELLNALLSSPAALEDGMILDQRAGLLVLQARGEAVSSLVARKAGHGAMPAIGESRRARFAEVAVSIVKVRAEETLLVVDRIYAPHVMASIRVSAADLAAGSLSEML